jgi:hypothetical protein
MGRHHDIARAIDANRARRVAGVLYRSDCWDIPNEFQSEGDFDILLQRAHKKAFRRDLPDDAYVRGDGSWSNTSEIRLDHVVYFPVERLFGQLKTLLCLRCSLLARNGIACA